MATGRWPYPILYVLDWPGRVAITLFTTAFLLAQVVLFRAALQARWGEYISQTARKKQPNKARAVRNKQAVDAVNSDK